MSAKDALSYEVSEETVQVTTDQALHMAVDLWKDNKIEEAEGIFRGVLEVDPGNFHATSHLGAILADQKKYYEALYRIDRALMIKKRDKNAISNRGMILGQLGHQDEAEAEFRRAIAIDPNNYVYWNNLGNTLERLGRYEESFMALNKCLSLNPEHAMSYFNRGIVLLRLFRVRDAISSFDTALKMDDRQFEAYYNRGIAKLMLGDFAGGWPDYEYRLDIAEGSYYVGPFSEPKWQGSESLEGKTVLIHAEQGLGDSIHFMRYMPLLLARGTRSVYMVAHSALKSMIKFDGVTVLETGQKYPPFDYWCPLMSLPMMFGTTLENIPPPWDIRQRNTAPSYSGKMRVGVCWSGNFKHKNDANRSIPLKQFAQIMDGVDAEFYSLQKDVRQIDLSDFVGLSNVVDLAPQLKNFECTAREIEKLDLVITVDTSVAHMAASLGTRTWILLPRQATDWRWMIDRIDSPWYPSVRLFRQSEVGGWDNVIKRARNELKAQLALVRQAA